MCCQHVIQADECYTVCDTDTSRYLKLCVSVDRQNRLRQEHCPYCVVGLPESIQFYVNKNCMSCQFNCSVGLFGGSFGLMAWGGPPKTTEKQCYNKSWEHHQNPGALSFMKPNTIKLSMCEVEIGLPGLETIRMIRKDVNQRCHKRKCNILSRQYV